MKIQILVFGLILGFSLWAQADDDYSFTLNVTPQRILESEGFGSAHHVPETSHKMTLGDVPTYGDCLKHLIENLVKAVGDQRFIAEKAVIETDPQIESVKFGLLIQNDSSESGYRCSGFNYINLNIDVRTKDGDGFGRKSLILDSKSTNAQSLILAMKSAMKEAKEGSAKAKIKIPTLKETIKIENPGKSTN